MFKNISKAAVLLLSIIMCSIQSMEQTISSGEKTRLTGPLKELQFEETEVKESQADNQEPHFGWLYAPEFDDHVYVAVTLHESLLCRLR